MTKLRVHYGNLYVKNRRKAAARRALFNNSPDVVVTVESGWLVPMAPRLKGYRLAVARSGPMSGRTDAAVWVKRRHEYLGEIVLLASPAMPAFGPAAHDRYVVAALFRVEGLGKVAAIAWHPTPGPVVLNRDPDPTHPITRAYVEGLKAALTLARNLRRQGFLIVFAADVQIPSGREVPWSPTVALAASGLDLTLAEGLDLLAADKQLEALWASPSPAIGEPDGGHAWLSAIYRRNRR